jgi:hypothetical protein
MYLGLVQGWLGDFLGRLKVYVGVDCRLVRVALMIYFGWFRVSLGLNPGLV